MHWRKIHKNDCDNVKENRNYKWNEISALPFAYLKTLKYASSLSDATSVWRKIGKLKSQQQPINSLLSRLAAVEASLKLKDYDQVNLRDTVTIAASEESARYLFKSCSGALDEILCSSSNEKLPCVERFVQRMQESFDYIETLYWYNFLPGVDLNDCIHEYTYLCIRLLRARGIMLSLQGQHENAIQSLLQAVEICTTKSVRRNEMWRHHS
jgi:tetratricopeptide (TPR) repeat protein